jgi:hypothetical protein
VVDGGKARIILSVLVTPASIMDNTPLLDMVDWVFARWELTPEIASGDAKLGTVPNLVDLDRGMKACIPLPDLTNRNQYYPASKFTYDSEKDQYTCPQGEILTLFSQRKSEENFVYQANAETCNACPVKEARTGSKSGRHIFRSFHQEYLDRVAAYAKVVGGGLLRRPGSWPRECSRPASVRASVGPPLCSPCHLQPGQVGRWRRDLAQDQHFNSLRPPASRRS